MQLVHSNIWLIQLLLYVTEKDFWGI